MTGRSESLFAAAWPVEGVRAIVGLALVLVITILSLRLLGIRRGWGTAALGGLLGWGVASLVALRIAAWDWGSDGLVLHILAIGVPATMAAAVAIDLLARPGSLAIGERAGLVVAPHPMRAVRTRISVLRRYRELVRLARQEGFGPLLAGADRSGRARDSKAIRLRRVLEEAGGVYVKLGQIAATRVDLVPADICAELADVAEPGPARAVGRASSRCSRPSSVTTSTRVFAEFEWEPLAAASIGQTHRARLHSGEPVVVKVQRPGHRGHDASAISPRWRCSPNLAQRRTSFGKVVRSGELLGQFAHGLRAELDFRREADAMTEMAARLDTTNVACPDGSTQSSARGGCSCRSGSRARRSSNLGPPSRSASSSGPDVDRPTSPTGCCARRSSRCCGSVTSTPIPTRATSSRWPTARSG